MLTIYKASAGSGKTFTLALEYIKLLLGVKIRETGAYVLNHKKYTGFGRLADRHRAILAITFTNAATEEMKSRIVRELGLLANDKKSNYRDKLLQLFGCTPAEMQEVAARALAEILYDYSNFNISTIDSFFQTVLRTFSRELDHNGDYELSLDLDDVVATSISVMLDDLNFSSGKSNSRLGQWIRRYVFDNLGSGKSYNFFNRSGNMLATLARFVSKALADEEYIDRAEDFRRYMAEPSRLREFEKALLERKKAIAANIAAAASEFMASIAACGMDSAPTKYFSERLRKAQAGELTASDLGLKAFSEFRETGSAKGFFLAKPWKAASESTQAEISSAVGTLIEVFDTASQADIYTEIYRSLPNLEFIGLTENYMQQFLRESNTVLISDTGELLKRIISDAEMPFIYERLGMRLNHLLIDEFQDTSRLQWHNLKPLVTNSVDNRNDSLIIGDEKQAIFRFRNSDSELLASEVENVDFPDKSVVRGHKAGENTNYRSAGAIVRFNNTIFSRVASETGFSDYYSNVVQTPGEKLLDVPAYIRINFIDERNEETTGAIFARLADDILRQHNAGYKWSDILILARVNKEAKDIAEYLMFNHPEIPLLSSEALLLNSSGAVRTIIGMLRLVERSYYSAPGPDNTHVYATKADIGLMISRFSYYTGEGFDAATALNMALSEEAGSEGIYNELEQIRAENPANIVALIETIVARKIPVPQREKEYAYIAALQDIAVKHCESADASLRTFLENYDRHIDKWAILASNKLNAVEIMTVHKSKGLERACVHIPFADWGKSHRSNDVWLTLDNGLAGFDSAIVPPLLRISVSDKSALKTSDLSPFCEHLRGLDRQEDADNLNLSYVAFTRASRELCVAATKDNVGDWLFNAISAPDTAADSTDIALMPVSEYFDPETGIFEYGTPTAPKPEESTADESAPDTVQAGNYEVFMREDTRELTTVDDILSAETDMDIGGEETKEIVDGQFENQAMAEAATRGLLMHSILQDVRTRADLPRAIRRAALRNRLDADAERAITAELDAAFDACAPHTARWFAPQNRVFAERTIYLPATGETFRPDRVVVTSDGNVEVIDYKFTSGVRRKHAQQMEVYLSLLRQIEQAPVTGYLWYPLLGKIIKM